MSGKKKPNEKFEPEQVIEAIEATNGIIAASARRLGCAWLTVKRYIETYPEVRKVYREQEESLLDMAESRLYKIVQNDSHNGQLTAIKYMLSTKGRHRGWGEKHDVNLNREFDFGGEAIDLSKLSRDELEVVKTLLEKAKSDGE